MAFDLRSAKPVGAPAAARGFDLSSARPISEEAQEKPEDKPAQIRPPVGDTPEKIYYNFVVDAVPLPEMKASLEAAGMEFNPRLYRQALMSASQTRGAVEAQRLGTEKAVTSGLRGVVGGGASMAEAISQLVPGETATDVAAFFREQERKQREAAAIPEIYGGAKMLTEVAPYVGLASKVARAKTLSSPVAQLVAQPTTQAAATYALTPEREVAPEEGGALFGLLPTTGGSKMDEAITAGLLTTAVEAPFAAFSAARRTFPKDTGMPPGPEELAAFRILKQREEQLLGGAEGKSLDEQIALARQDEEARRLAVEELQKKQAAEAAERQRILAEQEAERNARQQALIEQRRQAEIAEQEAKIASQQKMTQAREKSEQLKETAESEADRLKLEAKSPEKQFPDEDEIIRQEKINDAAVQASGTLENAAAKLEAQAAKRASEAAARTSIGEVKLYDLGERVRQTFIKTRNKLIEARKKAIGQGADVKQPEEGRGLLLHEKDVEARGGNLTGTEEFDEFSSFIKERSADESLTSPLRKVYEYIKREIDTGEEGTRSIPWQKLRFLRREIAEKISPTPEVSFGALTNAQNKELVKNIDDLLDAFVGGTKEAPGSYKRFLSAYAEGSKPLDIFKFGPGKTATEMGEWGRGLEYDREDVLKAVMYPTKSNAETIVELAGDNVDELVDVVRSALLKQSGGSAKGLRNTLDKYDEFLSIDAFSGIRNDLENLARTEKLNQGIAKRLQERAAALKKASESAKNVPSEVRKLLNTRDFSSDESLVGITRFLNANPSSRETVGNALGSLVEGMPDEQIVSVLSNPAKKAALIRAGLPANKADDLLSKANDAISDRAAKLQEAKRVKREARKEGRKIIQEAKAPVSSERQKVRELGAEISKTRAESRAASATEKSKLAEERAALAAAKEPAQKAKRLRVDLEQKRRALTDINEQPELAEAIIDAAKEIPINTSEGLINATTLGAIYTSTAQIVTGSPILSTIAGALGIRQALTQRAAKQAMLGRSKEEVRNRIKAELQQLINSKLKREEATQVIRNYEDVMAAQRRTNEILNSLGIIPGPAVASARKVYEAYGDSGTEEEMVEQEYDEEEFIEEEPSGPNIDLAIESQDAEDLRPIIDSIYEQESSSGRNVSALDENYAGAKGIMQVTPIAFQEVKQRGYIPEDYNFDNQQHLAEAGVAYIKYLSDLYDGDPEKIAAAYYGGPSAVTKTGISRNRRDPENPNAPTVGEYVDKVLSRIIPTAEAQGFARGGPVRYTPQEEMLLRKYGN